MKQHAYRIGGTCFVVVFLAACGANQGSTVTPQVPSARHSSHVKHAVSSCAQITDSTGAQYTAARLGGGNNLDIEASNFSNCEIGIYISPSNGPATLTKSTVNGSFNIGVYIDSVGTSNVNHVSICVNGAHPDGSCASGSTSSPGTGLDALNTPDLTVHQTYIDGYVADLATNPCPNSNNNIVVNQSSATNSTYAWSFQGGIINTNHDMPAPPQSGTCAGSGVGAGLPPGGNVYVADPYHNAIKEIVAAGGYATVNTLGSGFSLPAGVAVDGSGNVYVADTGNSAVKEIVAAGGYTTVNTLGSGFFYPSGVAVDGSGNVYVGDTNNNAVKEILAVGGYTTVKTLGSGFSNPYGVAVDGSSNVYVADAGNNAVKEVLAAGGYTTVNTLGSGFSYPTGVAVDGPGNVYVADAYNSAVKEILAAGGYTTVNTLGSGFYYPWGVAVDVSGNVYVADYFNSAVKEILAAGGYTSVNTLGSGFYYPSSVAVQHPAVPNIKRNHHGLHVKR